MNRQVDGRRRICFSATTIVSIVQRLSPPRQNLYGPIKGSATQPPFSRHPRSAIPVRRIGAVFGRHLHQLSGGQRQRVAIAQALAQRAPLLLMDEPFGALDEQTRGQLQDLLIQLQHDRNLGILFITHDVEEALYLGRRIHILRPDPDGARSEEHPVTGVSQPIPEIKQSEGFFKQLQALRARYYRNSRLQNDATHLRTAIGRGLIDETMLAEIERNAREIWVISQELRQDVQNPVIHAAVEENLRDGKRYHYVIPADDPVAAENREILLTQFSDYEDQITIKTLPRSTSVFHFGEVVLYDPTTDNAQGFTYLHGDERGLMIRLPDAFIDAHVRELRT